MPIENTLIAKIGGGLIAAGGATTVGVVYKDDISRWFSGSKQEDNFLFIVGAKNNTTANSDEDLYKTVTGNTTKTKNYFCKFNDQEYECEILKKIEDTNNKKLIDTKDLFAKSETTSQLDKTALQTEHTLFLLKVDVKNSGDFSWVDNKSFEIVQKENNADKSKKFGELTPIFGKKNNVLLNKVSLFLAKIKDFGSTTPVTTEYQIETGKTYKCDFLNSDTTPSNEKLKECSILKFVNDQQSNASATTQYDSLTFIGTETDLTTSDKLKQHGYYIVKLNNSVENSVFSTKKLIYLEVNTTTPKKIVNFSPFIPAFFSPQANSKQLLLVT